MENGFHLTENQPKKFTSFSLEQWTQEHSTFHPIFCLSENFLTFDKIGLGATQNSMHHSSLSEDLRLSKNLLLKQKSHTKTS